LEIINFFKDTKFPILLVMGTPLLDFVEVILREVKCFKLPRQSINTEKLALSLLKSVTTISVTCFEESQVTSNALQQSEKRDIVSNRVPPK